MNKLEQAARELLDAMKCKSLRVITQKETALREALAEQSYDKAHGISSYHLQETDQAEQEPVAYCCGFENTHPDGWIDCNIFRDGEFTTPLYAAPVRTKDLTDEELEDVCWWPWSGGWRKKAMKDFARAVITADREKNKC